MEQTLPEPILAEWICDEGTWRNYRDIVQRRVRVLGRVIVAILAALVVGLPLLWVISYLGYIRAANSIGATVVSLIIAGVTLATLGLGWQLGRQTSRELNTKTGEVTITLGRLMINGDAFNWEFSATPLGWSIGGKIQRLLNCKRRTLTGRRGRGFEVLVFSCGRTIFDALQGNPEITVERLAPIPAGRVDEADRIVERLNERIRMIT